ncbi:putative Serine/threonine protein kinase [Taphrina deformans PYCC 5710]|uniref:non-specific serine/threonine protein kinase n=1 Tax=Taphrina deformans (strain PYCC 5710 / ATCC 11124 / CBS 356.35 / IMI 108563 / JCM 9778 / NBRC 8474) TaxID=1097556 RepID=R4XEW4_TAPDE|nr:putative Serine/threonine protein kinase [Taphrina deformans PYCC 5710]|eukprot:CCG83016.1 putative Serine/threonine protein kinase [Taphrina deformans PYCC 5710]
MADSLVSQTIQEEGETSPMVARVLPTPAQHNSQHGYFDRNGTSNGHRTTNHDSSNGNDSKNPISTPESTTTTLDGSSTPVPPTPSVSTRPVAEPRESQSQTTTKKTISRLQRMFSQTGRKESSLAVAHKPGSATPSGTHTPEDSHPTPKDPEKEERLKSMTADERVVAMRFDYNDKDGTHAHHLKRQKREEKLKNMLKDMLGGKAKREEEERKVEAEEAHQLSLIKSWVAQGPHNDTDEALKIAKQKDKHQESSFVEKYGRCHEIVGRGAFGIVRIAHKIDSTTGKEKLYAVKEFRKKPSESEKKYQKRLTSEYCISSAAKHPNVINTLDLLQDAQGDYCEVMEFCAGGDLYSLILAAGKLELAEADCYFKQLMRGVGYLHDMGVAHRDLKPENLLLTPSGSLKIADFGNGECFRMAWEKQSHMTAGLCGSAPYIAPEEYSEKEFDPAEVDVWACGVIFMAMRTGRHLWRMAKRDEDDFYERYLEGRKTEGGYEPIEALSRARCRNVVYSMLDPNPKRRLTSKQVLQSEWLTGVWTCKAADVGA